MSTETKILCVDDEPRVLEGLENHLAMDYNLHTACSGAEGLETIEQHGPFAVVISDMRMPEMNGAQFLSRVRERYPQTTRMLLTGQSDIDSAIAAINQGSIFRFLSKPCSPKDLLASVKDAVRQNELIRSERELLEDTLSGAVAVLSEVIGLTTPDALKRSSSVLELVQHMCLKLRVTDSWRFELAARLSQLGCVALPPETLNKVYAGQALDEVEREMVDNHPVVGGRLLSKIPRLEGIALMVAGQSEPPAWNGTVPLVSDEQAVALGSNMLAVALAFDQLLGSGVNHQGACQRLRESKHLSHSLVELLSDFQPRGMRDTVQALALSALRPTMVLDQDVRSNVGHLVVGKGHEVTPALLERLSNFAKGMGIVEPIRVRVPGAVRGKR